MQPRHPLKSAVSAISPALWGVGVFSFFINLLVFVSPAFMLQVYDRVLTSRNGTTLLMLAAIAAGLLFSYALLEKLRSMVLVQMGLRFDSVLGGPAFDAALAGSARERGGRHAQLLRDVDTLREFVSGPALPTLLDAPWAPVFLAVCFLLHPLIGWVALGGAVLLFSLAFWNERLTRRALLQESTGTIAAYERMAAALRNADAIRGLGMAGAIRGAWERDHAEIVARSVSVNGRGGLILALSKFLRSALQVGILAVGAWLVIRQELSGGAMFAASLIMGRALAPVEQALAQWRSLTSARSAWSRLSSALDAAEDKPLLKLPKPAGAVEMEDVTVLAPGSRRPVLKRVTLSLSPGEVLAVVGPTGSGKSSLLRALVGAWPAVTGCVRYDGNDLRHYDPDDVGAGIGYLPQDVELFAGTVAENIARFGPVDDTGILAAAEAASAHGMIQHLPDGYQTQVGEDGSSLSGGQRQRIGLARALYGEPAVVVLDEPNANLDGEGDAALVESLRRLKEKGRTAVLVTHRPGLLAVADKIMVMQDGMVARIGPRDLLLPLILGPNVQTAARTLAQAQATTGQSLPRVQVPGQMSAQVQGRMGAA
jgi:PrtD family type I secretion system ABC transporter